MNTEVSQSPNGRTSRAANLLLKIGALLLGSGSNSRRISVNMLRIANAWGYNLELFSSFTGIMITLTDKDNPQDTITRFQRVPMHGVNFAIVSSISILSWDVHNDQLEIEEVEAKIEKIREIPHYPRWILFLGIGLACASLCLLMNGDYKNAGIAFIASVAGLYCRQILTKKRFNILISVLAASFVTSIIAGMDVLMHLGKTPESTLATSVLYLVPGVPLLNAIMDMVEGHIPTAIARGIYGACIVLSIAIGMILSMLIIGFNNY